SASPPRRATGNRSPPERQGRAQRWRWTCPWSCSQSPLALDDIRGRDGQREIDHGQEPEPAPILRDFGEACTQLIDADDAVDRELDREDMAGDEHCMRNRFARPGEPCEEELRQAGGEEDEGRRLRTLEPGADRLG